jgi:hypothetical protein
VGCTKADPLLDSKGSADNTCIRILHKTILLKTISTVNYEIQIMLFAHKILGPVICMIDYGYIVQRQRAFNIINPKITYHGKIIANVLGLGHVNL